MNVNDLTRHGFHQGLTPGFLFNTVSTHCPVAARWGRIITENYVIHLPIEPQAGVQTGAWHIWLYFGSGDTRNMDKCPALNMGYSRSRNKCLAGCVLLFPSQAQRFPFWCGYGHSIITTHSTHISPLAPPQCLPLKTQQSKLWSGQTNVTLVIILLPLWLLFLLLQPLLLILLIWWLVTLYTVPSTELLTYIFSFDPYEVTLVLFLLPR